MHLKDGNLQMIHFTRAFQSKLSRFNYDVPLQAMALNQHVTHMEALLEV